MGIDVEEVRAPDDTTRQIALTRAEAALMDRCAAEGAEPAARWFTRFWAAKEAVSKAEGTGLEGRPRRFQVVAATASELVVRRTPDDEEPVGTAGAAGAYRVRCADIRNPEQLPERDYVVAWTTGPADKQETTP